MVLLTTQGRDSKVDPIAMIDSGQPDSVDDDSGNSVDDDSGNSILIVFGQCLEEGVPIGTEQRQVKKKERVVSAVPHPNIRQQDMLSLWCCRQKRVSRCMHVIVVPRQTEKGQLFERGKLADERDKGMQRGEAHV